MVAFRFDLLLVAAMLPAWISCSVQAASTGTIDGKRLRGQPQRPTINTNMQRNDLDITHVKIPGPRSQRRATKPRNDKQQTTNYLDNEIIDEQGESPEEASHRQKMRNERSKIDLPRGTLGREYNRSLYEELHNAPYDIYESAFDVHEEERDDSFPVFIVKDWQKETTGVYSGFSRTASSFIFQNMQVLLSWNDIVEASTGADPELTRFIQRNEFETSLFIGKTIAGSNSDVPFLGLMVSYHQRSQKHILVPFGKLEHFFDDTSEKYLLSESIQHLEYDALHNMLDEERSTTNSTNKFFHPEIVADTSNKKQMKQFEDIEAIHFRKLYQLLIRRTFLFSFGYADCLREEPHTLRACLDDTFSLVVQMESTVRDAIDDQLIEELAKVAKYNNDSKLREVCVSGKPDSFGTNDCAKVGRTPLSALDTAAFTAAFR